MDQELIQAYIAAKYVIKLDAKTPKNMSFQEACDPIEKTQPSDDPQSLKKTISEYDLEFAKAMRVKLGMNRQLRLKAAAVKEGTSIEIRVGSTYPAFDRLKSLHCAQPRENPQ